MKELGQRTERGGSAGAAIGILALLAVVAGGVYLWSDPIRTKTDAALRGMSEWTPENIAADPINYLNFCEEETNNALQKLKASEISIAQKRAQLADMKTKSEKKIAVGDKALGELKLAYRGAETAGAFPVEWNGKTYDQAACQKQILSLHGQVKSETVLLGKIDGGLKKLDAQKIRVIDQRAQAKAQLTEIQTNREMLKIEEISDQLTQQLVSMKSVLQTTLATADESSEFASLDDLAASAESSVDAEKFDSIMSEE